MTIDTFKARRRIRRNGTANFGVVIGLVMLCWGILLAFILMVGAMKYHGTEGAGYFILASSPICILNNRMIAFFGIPVLWMAFGALAGTADQKRSRQIFLILFACHVIAALVVFAGMHFFSHAIFTEWDAFFAQSSVHFNDAPALVCYLVGQAIVWISFFAAYLSRGKSLPSSM